MKKIILLCCVMGVLTACASNRAGNTANASKVDFYGVVDVGVGYTNQKTTISK